jgi:competence protein ComEC
MRYWLTARLHVSWIIMTWCLSVFLGIVVAASSQYVWIMSLGWLLTGCAFGLFGFVRQQRWVVLLAIISGMIIGLWRGTLASSELSVYQPLIGKNLTLQGTVSDDIDHDKRGNTVLRLIAIQIEQRKTTGVVWVVLGQKDANIRRSDRITVSGELAEGFGTFAGSMYQANLVKAERSIGVDMALDVRDWFSSAVRSVIVEPAASLGLGFLVGQRRDLPPGLEEALRIAGLTHIIVASGYNLTILVRITRRLLEKVSKYLATVVSFGLITGFVAVTGASPSMSRAGLVTSLALLAWYCGRTFNPFVLLAVAVATTTLINPLYAWGDIGWQLSFAAFAGVMILAPVLQAYFFGDTKPGLFRQILGETVAASICTLPILLLSFGYISNIALFANLLIVSLIPLAMLLVFISGVVGLAIPLLAPLVALPTTWLLGYMIYIAEWFSKLDWAVTEVTLAPWQAGLMYAAIVTAGVYMWRQTRIDLGKTSVIE